MQSADEQINDIIDIFDFAKVEKVMHFLNWKWRGEMPTQYDMRKKARELLKSCYSKNHEFCGTGGFTARMYKISDVKDDVRFELSFYIETADTLD